MSNHGNDTQAVYQALVKHGMATDTPSQLADAFRLGWFAALEAHEWRDIESAPLGKSGDESTYFIGARWDGKRLNTATCYRNSCGSFEWWGGGMAPTLWKPLDLPKAGDA